MDRQKVDRLLGRYIRALERAVAGGGESLLPHLETARSVLVRWRDGADESDVAETFQAEFEQFLDVDAPDDAAEAVAAAFADLLTAFNVPA
jgi:hypothetical protein